MYTRCTKKESRNIMSILSFDTEMALMNQRELADRLAAAITACDANTARALLEQWSHAGGQAPAKTATPELPVTSPADNKIAIYKAREIKGTHVYMRDERDYKEWFRYAGVHKFNAVSDASRRVVYIGESVARGFLFSPFYTPAQVLSSLLNQAGTGETEVIDLAADNQDMDELKRIFQESQQLKPDYFVLFAGNNWRTVINNRLTAEDYRNIYQLMVEGGDGNNTIKQYVENIFREEIRHFLAFVQQVKWAPHIPVLFIIPEYNLVDFVSNPLEDTVSEKLNKDIKAWAVAREAAEAAQLEGDDTKQAAAARRLISLDKTTAAGYELLAASQLRQQQWDQARNNLEQARDTALYFKSDSKPRRFEIIREVLLELAPDFGVDVLDSKTLFADLFPGSLPGKALFMDYCHLTVEGIQVTMEHTAKLILSVFTGLPASHFMPDAGALVPDKKTWGLAHIFAAIHNAHWGQGSDIVTYHCRKGLEYYPAAASFVQLYMDMASQNIPVNLSRSYGEIGKSGLADQYFSAIIPPREIRTMDLLLVDAMEEALKSQGIPAAMNLADMRVREFGVAAGQEINLLDPLYYRTSYNINYLLPKAYFQANHYKSIFYLVAAGKSAVDISMTYRIPHNAAGEGRLLLNGVPVAVLKPVSVWQHIQVELPAELIHHGVNHLVTEWPLPEKKQDADPPVLHASGRDQIFRELYFVFGEIHTFTASYASVEEFFLIAAENHTIS